jgi:hypothetical protein
MLFGWPESVLSQRAVSVCIGFAESLAGILDSAGLSICTLRPSGEARSARPAQNRGLSFIVGFRDENATFLGSAKVGTQKSLPA